MGISLKPQHLKRYQQIAWIFMKYGRSDLVQTSGLSEVLETEQKLELEQIAKAEELAADLEKLGPTFVKLGQLHRRARSAQFFLRLTARRASASFAGCSSAF